MRKFLLVLLFGLIASTPGLTAEVEVDANVEKANSYDDAWEAAWVKEMKKIHNRSKNKTEGFVFHLGDSITYQNSYGNFPRRYDGSHEIGKTVQWSFGGEKKYPDKVEGDCKNGWALTSFDHPAGGRSYTAQGGITTYQWLSGGKTVGLGPEDKNPLDTILENTHAGAHPNSAKGYIVPIVSDAQMCVLMLGTNDISAGKSPASIKENLKTIVDKLKAKDIMPLLSTLSPYTDHEADVIAVNSEIRNLAREMKIPMIDFYAECVRRRPENQWKGTMSGDGVHPNTGKYEDPFEHPEVFSNNGSLLRGYLSICKIHEVKKYVMDGAPVPKAAGTGSGSSGGDLELVSPEFPATVVGNEVEIQLEATGGAPPYKFSAVGLPRGVKLSRDGLLSGTTKKAKKYRCKLKVQDKKNRVVRLTVEWVIE